MDHLHDLMTRAGAARIPFGPADSGIEIVESFGTYPLEYAAIRKAVGILHLPQRGILRFAGKDVKDFLHRLTTQDIRPMTGGQSRRTFQLDNKGRIVADAVLHHGDADTWLELDRFDIDSLYALLDARLFREDVKMAKWVDERVWFALFGPATPELLAAIASDADAARKAGETPGTHHVVTLAGQPVTVARNELCGGPGVSLAVPRDHAGTLYQAMLDAAGFDPNAPDPKVDPQAAADAMAKRRQSLRGRPIGWSAFNTARIEAGSPLFHIDFGNDCLPHETGILPQAVSFTKGCYLGQEIVARMQNLGHPKRMLAGLTFPDDRLPIAGSQVLDADDRSTIIGAVTSSTLAPLRSNTAIAFAMLKWGKHREGTKVVVPAEGGLVEATVGALESMK